MLEGHEYDNRWTVKDKISQYRGLLALREKEVRKARDEFVREKDEGAQKLYELKKDVRHLRRQINDLQSGNIVRNVLQENRLILQALRNKNTQDIINELRQRNCIKVKEVNKLQYLKSLKMEKLEKNLVELEEIKKNVEFGYSLKSYDQRQQILTRDIENTRVRHNIARCAYNAYQKMVNIMKEDSLYLDHVVKVISRDADEQYHFIRTVRFKGERAALENERLRSDLHQLEKETVALLRARDRSLRQLRQQINQLAERLRGTPGEDSDAPLRLDMFRDRDATIYFDRTPILLMGFEFTMKELQEKTKVTDYRDIFSRVREQLERKEQLLTQRKLCEENKSSSIEKRDCLKETLALIRHTQSEACKRYDEAVEDIRNQMKEVKENTETSDSLVDELGKKLMDMRAAVTTLYEIVSRVKTPEEVAMLPLEMELTFKEIVSQIEDPRETLELIKVKVLKLRNEIGAAMEEWPILKTEDAEKLREQIKEKQPPELKALVLRDPMVVVDARKEYHNKATEYITKAHFGETVEFTYDLGAEEEHELGVATRSDIKTASRRIVQDYEATLLGYASKKGANTLHKRMKPKRRKWT